MKRVGRDPGDQAIYKEPAISPTIILFIGSSPQSSQSLLSHPPTILSSIQFPVTVKPRSFPSARKMRFTQSFVSGLTLLSGSALAHPGYDLTQEIAERREFLGSVKRADLSHCAAKLKARGVSERNVARRTAVIEKARAKRGLKKRDLDTVLATSHNATELGYTVNTDAATLFSGNNSCVLTPEVTQGPYCKSHFHGRSAG